MGGVEGASLWIIKTKTKIERFTLSRKGGRDASNLLECDTLKDRAIDLMDSPNR
jgi:hypothetical protein